MSTSATFNEIKQLVNVTVPMTTDVLDPDILSLFSKSDFNICPARPVYIFEDFLLPTQVLKNINLRCLFFIDRNIPDGLTRTVSPEILHACDWARKKHLL